MSTVLHKKEYYRGAALAGAGEFVGRASTFVSMVIVANMVSREDYGTFALLLAYGATIGTVARFGLATAVCRFVAPQTLSPRKEYMGPIRAALFLWVVATAIVLTIAVFVSPVVAERLYDRPSLSQMLLVFALYGVLQALSFIGRGIAQGFQAFGRMAIANMLVGVLTIVLTAVLTPRYGMNGAVIAAVAGIFANAVAMMWASFHVCGSRMGDWIALPLRGDVARTASFAFPVFISSLFNFPVTWLSLSLLANQADLGAAGRFSAANVFRLGAGLVAMAFSAPVLPTLVKLSEHRDRSAYQSAILESVRILLCVSVLIAVAVLALPETWLRLMGRNYAGASDVLIPLMLSTVLAGISVVPGIVLSTGGSGRMWLGVLSNALWSAALLIAGFLMVRTGDGARGLAWAYVISYAAVILFHAGYLRIALSIRLMALVRPLAFGAAGLLAAWKIAAVGVIPIQALLGCIIAGVMLYSMLERSERAMLMTRLRRVMARRDAASEVSS